MLLLKQPKLYELVGGNVEATSSQQVTFSCELTEIENKTPNKGLLGQYVFKADSFWESL